MSNIYRPNIEDPSRHFRKRVKKIKKKTGMKISFIEKKIFELGIAIAEKESN